MDHVTEHGLKSGGFSVLRGSSMPQLSTRVFISYSHDDAELARNLWSALSRDGFEPWIAECNIPGGVQRWASEVTKAIEISDIVILLRSCSSLCSEQVLNEMYVANKYHKPVMVIEIEPIQQTRMNALNARDFDYFTSRVQRISLTEVGISGCPSIIRRYLQGGAIKGERLSSLAECHRVCRDAVLAHLDREWRPLITDASQPYLFGLVGLSGSGKTTLADDFLDRLPCPDRRVRSGPYLDDLAPIAGAVVLFDDLVADEIREIGPTLRSKIGRRHLLVTAYRKDHVESLKRYMPDHLGPMILEVGGLTEDEFLQACFGGRPAQDGNSHKSIANKVFSACQGLVLIAVLFSELIERANRDELIFEARFFDQLETGEIVAFLFDKLLHELAGAKSSGANDTSRSNNIGNQLAKRVLVVLSELSVIGMDLDALAHILDVPPTAGLAGAISRLQSRGLIERVQGRDSALRCHTLLKKMAGNHCSAEEINVYRRRYLTYLGDLLNYSSDSISSHRSSITFWDAIMNKITLDFWKPGVFEARREKDLASFLINLDLFSMSEDGHLKQGVVRFERGAVKDWLRCNVGVYIHDLNCAHGIALAQLARKFTVPDPQLGDGFMVGWNAQNEIGHGFSRTAEKVIGLPKATVTVDDWVRSECVLTSAYHWSALSADDKKKKAELIQNNCRQHFSRPHNDFSSLLGAAYGIALVKVGDPRLAHHVIAGLGIDARYPLFCIILHLHERGQHRIIDDMFTYYGSRFRNMPEILQAFLHVIGRGSLPYGAADVEYNGKLKYVLGSWSESEEFQEFVTDLVARSENLTADFVRCRIARYALHDVVRIWRMRH
jgi:hypothetical protein